MKGKLIKTDDGYHLKGLIKDIPKGINVYNKINDKECHFGFGTHSGKLSLKNCQAIANGYDLCELADEYAKYVNDDDGTSDIDFKVGFQKALELLGDKKFSEQQIRKAIELAWRNKDSDKVDIIKTIQQEIEWQVEVVMDRIPADLAPGGWDVFPKLDKDNCLILKRVE